MSIRCASGSFVLVPAVEGSRVRHWRPHDEVMMIIAIDRFCFFLARSFGFAEHALRCIIWDDSINWLIECIRGIANENFMNIAPSFNACARLATMSATITSHRFRRLCADRHAYSV